MSKRFTALAIFIPVLVGLIGGSVANANSGHASAGPYISPAARAFMLAAPAGSCVNNWNQAGCVKPKRIVVLGPDAPAAQTNAQCNVNAREPQRTQNWMYGTAVAYCVGGVQDVGVYSELKMFAYSYGAWKTAARNLHPDKLNHDGLARERTWSRCTGGWGKPWHSRPWETLAHGFYTINWVLYLKTVRSTRVRRFCIHKV